MLQSSSNQGVWFTCQMLHIWCVVQFKLNTILSWLPKQQHGYCLLQWLTIKLLLFNKILSLIGHHFLQNSVRQISMKQTLAWQIIFTRLMIVYGSESWGNVLLLNLCTLISVCIFTKLFPRHFLRFWQGKIV